MPNVVLAFCFEGPDSLRDLKYFAERSWILQTGGARSFGGQSTRSWPAPRAETSEGLPRGQPSHGLRSHTFGG